MDGYQKRTERKKESIRQAALDLFSRFGIGKVSVNEIAKQANVSHVTIYKYFGSKNGLVSDILMTRFKAQLQRLREIVHSEKSFTDKLEEMFLDKLHTTSPLHEEMTRQAITASPELKKFFESILKTEMPQLYLELINGGIKEGLIDPQIPHEAILLYLYLIRAGAIADPQSWAEFNTNERSLRDFQNLILYGLMGKRDKDKNEGLESSKD